MQQSYVTKVIKNKTYNNNTTYYWNSSYSSGGYYSRGELIYASKFVNNQYGQINNVNNIFYTTNTTLYNGLDLSLKNQIATTRWYFKSYTSTSWAYGLSTSDIYYYERNGWVYRYGQGDFNIGLISMLDYKYAVLGNICNRTSNYSDYNNSCGNINNNWIASMMYNSYKDWTWILNVPGYCNENFSCHYGAVSIYAGSTNVYLNNIVNMSAKYALYPVFHIKSQSYITRGYGTSTNPYYISI